MKTMIYMNNINDITIDVGNEKANNIVISHFLNEIASCNGKIKAIANSYNSVMDLPNLKYAEEDSLDPGTYKIVIAELDDEELSEKLCIDFK